MSARGDRGRQQSGTQPPHGPARSSDPPARSERIPQPVRDTRFDLDLAGLIDVAGTQSLMEEFYRIAGIPMGVIDLSGRVIVGVGWQRICTDFHRVHPETCAHCIESDTELSLGLRPGEFRLYKCKNNMWDIATPIMMGDRHVANIFSGQFFFEGEALDYALFRTQARRYGFDEAQYIAALDAVPRLTRAAVEAGMAFFMKLAQMLSGLGHTNLELARSMAERDELMTSLRDSEADLARAQAVAHTGSWRLDVRRDVLTWSDEVYRIFGIPRGTSMTYEAFLAAVHPDDRAFVDEAWQAALTGRPYDIEHRIVAGTGIAWVREKAELEFDASGALLGGFGTVQDITKRKRMEGELCERAEQLGEANRMKDEFLATLSHELRTPLNAILGWADILRRGGIGEDAVERAHDAIYRNAQAQRALIDDVLDVARIISGKLRFEVNPIDVTVPLRAAIDSVRPAADARQIEIVTDLDAIRATVSGDPTRLQQIFWNLLSNAVKFTPAGGRVRVSGSLVDAQVQIQVADTGVGMDAGFLPHAFERFSQRDSSTTRRHGGLGLGLAIVRHLVEMHGGTVTAESPGEGCGSTFTVRLPPRRVG